MYLAHASANCLTMIWTGSQDRWEMFYTVFNAEHKYFDLNSVDCQ